MCEEKTVIANINDAYSFVATCAPYKINKAVMTVPGCPDMTVWVVALRGTNQSMDKNDPLGLPVCIRSCIGKDNVFFDLVKKAMLKEIPAGENVIFFAHSLGGMVSQQLGADKELSSRYRILNILTFGSPYVLFRGSKCILRRMAERADIIPMICSPAFALNAFLGNVTFESAGYYFNFLGAHCDSYEKGVPWRVYDCFGIKNGGRKVTLL